MGARVGITGRDRARAERAAAAIAREPRNPAVDVLVADMSSQTEVRRLAAEVLSAYPRLDVLSTTSAGPGPTADGQRTGPCGDRVVWGAGPGGKRTLTL